MLCRSFRCLLLVRWTLAGLLCVVLVGAAAAPASFPLGYDEFTSISLRAPEAPLAAVATTSTLRFEKQANAVRLILHKPGRSTHLSAAQRSSTVLAGPKAHHVVRVLARRFLQPRQLTASFPDDAGEPFLASSLIS